MSELVVIAGAGPVGTVLAMLLSRHGYRVRILERRSDPRRAAAERGRSINLTLATRGLQALDRAGMLERLRPEMMPMRGRRVHDKAGNGPLVPYGQGPHEVIYAISRARLNIALIAAAAETPGVEIVFDARVHDVDPLTGVVQWRDLHDAPRTEPQARFVVAADGAGSRLRQALADRGLLEVSEEPLAHDYKELNIPALPAGRWALDPGALHVWPRGEFMAIAMSNPDGTLTATLFMAQTLFAELRAPEVARRFFAGHFPDLLRLIPDFDAEFATHPQSRLGTVRCHPWHLHRVLLIGDAAHAIVPFHGQGLNCGFEDCVMIDDLLGRHREPEPAFAEFNRARRPNADAIAAMAIDNYRDMREAMLSPDFVSRKALAQALERRFPERFIPRYSMVMFHAEIPYSEALRRGALQERVLDALQAAGAGAESGLAAQLLDRAEL
jgi:kynurenine 3-monooxygenase